MTETSAPSVHRKTSGPRKRRSKRGFWIKFLVIVLVLYYTPVPGYGWRLKEALAEHGLSRQTLTAMARHTDWFLRYFTGPTSDDDLIRHLHQHRADMERAAAFFSQNSYCNIVLGPTKNQECEQLQQRTRMIVGGTGLSLENSIYRLKGYTCGSRCYVQDHSFLDLETQDWWRGWNRDLHAWKKALLYGHLAINLGLSEWGEVRAWEKSLLYVPPLLPAARFGLDPKFYPDDPVEAMRRWCHVKNELDSVPPELEKGPHRYKECAIRHIEGQWFIHLRPVISLG